MRGQVSDRQRLRRALLLLAAAVTRPARAADPIYVVVSARGSVRSVSQKEVLALYTGRSRTLDDGTLLAPLDHPRDSPARAAFYQVLTGMDVSRIDSYWARLHFTGQVQPPLALADDAGIVQRLRADPGAIGYLGREPVDPAVRVVLRLQ